MTLSAREDLQRLSQLYGLGFQDTFLDSALRKLVARQIDRDQEDLERINAVLDHYEQEYGLTSADFWQRYAAGQMTDTADLMEWSAFCKMRQRILARLEILKSEKHG
jgi:hypothetical protein